MDSCVDNTTAITTVLASILFLVSEVLPFTSKVKGDGIVQVISDVLVTYLKKSQEIQETQEA